jgi:hypothetical protein
MKRVLVVLVLVAAACSLNPQPFPPDNPDAALGGKDASSADASAFGDGAGTIPDAETDSAPGPESDGGSEDASDTDASDALIDVVVDAPNDVVLDVSLD